MKTFYRLKLGIWIALLAACIPGGIDTNMNEGGSSVSPEIPVRVHFASGLPASEAEVRRVTSNFDPSVSGSGILIRKTDTLGQAFLPGKRSVYYNLIAHDSLTGQWAFAESLRVSEKYDTLTLTDPLRVEIHLLTASSQPDSGLVFFPGTDILIRCRAESPCRSGDVPRGLRKVVARAFSGWQQTLTWEGQAGAILDTSLSTPPPDTLHLYIGPQGLRTRP